MTKRILMAAAAITLLMMTVSTACTKDYPADDSTHDSAVEGIWYTDYTGKTAALWNYGTVWNSMILRADGTGVMDFFYTLNGKAVANQSKSFTYTTGDGQLTLSAENGSVAYSYKISDGQLALNRTGNDITYQKADEDMSANIEEWSRQDLVDVPAPARRTVFVYGNAGGKMDYIIEDGFWKRLQPQLTDSTNVRVVCFYKYGKETSSSMDDDGDIVWFELNSETNLDDLREEGLASMGFAEQARNMKLCDPATLKMVLQLSSLKCPAQEYFFCIWGHGSGFDPANDLPGKYDQTAAATRGVIGDEWNENEQLDMYELSQAIRESGAVGRMNTVFFHNCLMGNMETLTELRDVTDYICCSAHILSSDGIVLSAFVKGLMECKNTEDAVKQMFEEIRPEWDNQYIEDYSAESEGLPNGDFKMLRTDKFDALLTTSRRLATRLVELYPTQAEAIGRAVTRVYRFRRYTDNPQFSYICPFFDLADFAHKLAEETGDAELTAISGDMDKAFDEAVVHYADISWNKQHLDHYTLSVCLYHQGYYNFDYVGAGIPWLSNIDSGYEQSAFHQLTGWGNFLRINNTVPMGNPVSGGTESE